MIPRQRFGSALARGNGAMDANLASLERQFNAEPDNLLLLNALRRQVERAGGDSVETLKRLGRRNGQQAFFLLQLAKDKQIPHVKVMGRWLIRWFRSFEDSLQIHGLAPKAEAAIRSAGLASVPGLIMLLNHPAALVRKCSAFLLDEQVAAECFDVKYLSNYGYQNRLLKIYLAMDLRVRGKTIDRWFQSFESSINAGGEGGRAARALGELGRAAMPRMRDAFESNDLEFQLGCLHFYQTLHPEIRGLPELFYTRAGGAMLSGWNRFEPGIHEPPEVTALTERIWEMAERKGPYGVRLYVELYRRNTYGRYGIRRRLTQFIRRHGLGRRILEPYLRDQNSNVRALAQEILSPNH
ncbi:MAG: hypothetical protein P1V97_02235 [Planctomycetota bacterium]|nr:hypothetical protein [Planctomycetota bacterium]